MARSGVSPLITLVFRSGVHQSLISGQAFFRQKQFYGGRDSLLWAMHSSGVSVVASWSSSPGGSDIKPNGRVPPNLGSIHSSKRILQLLTIRADVTSMGSVELASYCMVLALRIICYLNAQHDLPDNAGSTKTQGAPRRSTSCRVRLYGYLVVHPRRRSDHALVTGTNYQ